MHVYNDFYRWCGYSSLVRTKLDRMRMGVRQGAVFHVNRHLHMTLACPQCKSPVAREGQRFCYRCGNDLREYYEALNIKQPDEQEAPPRPEPGIQSPAI